MKRLIALLLSAILTAAVFTGCGRNQDTAQETPDATVSVSPAATPVPITAPTPTPVPTPDAPVSPDVVVDPVEEGQVQDTQDMTLEIHGEDETITLTQITGSFASAGGPSFSMYVDTTRYQVNDIGGYCYVTLRTGMSGDVYAELGFRSGADAPTLAGTILDEYGLMQTTGDFGNEQLGSYTVHHVQGETVQNIFDVYLLETASGCVTMVVSTTSETAAHRTRLLATLETLQIS